MELNAIQAELDRIEAEAARQTKLLLDNQDEFTAALQLAAKLKANSQALDDINVIPIYHHWGVKFNIYSSHTRPDAIHQALIDAQITVVVNPGFNDELKSWDPVGNPVHIFMPADMIPGLEQLPEAA